MGYIDEFCRTKETKNINKQLKDMYNKWYETWKCDEEKTKKDYFHPQLLTCTDAYLERRIMMFGKEAHTTTTGFEWQKGYLEDDSWYGYDKMIFEGKANNTFFLKTRKLIAGINDYGNKNGFKDRPEDKYDFTSVVMNNLNKTSKNGQYASVEELSEFLYKPFEFNGNIGTVYQHEINILKPKKIAMCCGKGYIAHIQRDFGESFDIDYEKFNMMSVKENSALLPYSEVVILNKNKTKELFWYEGEIDIIYTMHPSSRMTQEVRRRYDEGIGNFVLG